MLLFSLQMSVFKKEEKFQFLAHASKTNAEASQIRTLRQQHEVAVVMGNAV